MSEFAREGLVVPVKRPLNAMDAFIGCCEGFSIKLSDDSLDRETLYSLDEARSVAGGQMR
jgi:hypothetical protein